MNYVSYTFQSLLTFVMIYMAYKLFKKNERSDPGINEEERLKRTVKEVWSDLMGHVDSSLSSVLSEVRGAIDLSTVVVKLKTELADLQIKQSVKEEQWARKEREIDHKVGLERIRQEQELRIEKGKLEVELDRRTLDVQKTALEAERKKFEEHLKFAQDRFEKEVTHQRELIERLVGDVTRSYKNNNSGSV